MNIHENFKSEFLGNVYNVGEIFVYANDGKIPHFHIQRYDGPDVNVRICMDWYFTHGDTEREIIPNHDCVSLTKKQCIILDYWLFMVESKEKKRNWRKIAECWNRLNPEYKIDYKTIHQNFQRHFDCIHQNTNYHIGTIDGIGEVHLFGDEDFTIPHFHIISRGKPDCRVCIYDNRYYRSKLPIRQLTNDECVKLNNWLSDTHITNMSNWERIALSWNGSNEHCIYNPTKKEKVQPDYSTIW